MIQFPDRVLFSVSNTPGTSGGFAVNAAETNFRTPAGASVANNTELVVLAYEGTAWEICESVYTTVDTTCSRGTLLASSSGSAINFTSAVKVGSLGSGRELDTFLLHIGTTAPSSPAHGKKWWNSEIGKMFVYYKDGTSNQWVEADAVDNNTFDGNCGDAKTRDWTHHIDGGGAA